MRLPLKEIVGNISNSVGEFGQAGTLNLRRPAAAYPGHIHAPRESGSCQREPCRCGRRARFHVRGQAPSRRLYQRFDPSTAIQVEVACNRWPRIACLRTALGEQRTDVTFLESRNSPFRRRPCRLSSCGGSCFQPTAGNLPTILPTHFQPAGRIQGASQRCISPSA